MFTGIIETMGELVKVEKEQTNLHLHIRSTLAKELMQECEQPHFWKTCLANPWYGLGRPLKKYIFENGHKAYIWVVNSNRDRTGIP